MYIIKTIILVAVILAVIYIFLFKRSKSLKAKSIDSVRDYHETYLKEKTRDKNVKGSDTHHSYNLLFGDSGNSNRTNYVTRYNSEEDYREI